MAFYSVRSERAFCEQLDCNLVLVPRHEHRRRIVRPQRVFGESGAAARARRGGAICRRGGVPGWHYGLMSKEHFTVDGTLVEAWASIKSFRRKKDKKLPTDDDPKNPTVDFSR